ncbi:flagellar assembly protein FliW [Paenibacillus zanthoxyli]|uniref:flagellar assembly protein FliW n=1 Tax=Paenibacillus zanthoxyli TaxID=369399 RepID=UPI0004B158F2|nr:flagellar assembly protein FliW [Paenibacillus zanthoxyli]
MMTPDQTLETAAADTVLPVYQFPNGLPGFEQLKAYRVEEHNELFSLLSAIDQPEVSFITIDPFHLRPDYEFILSDEVIQLLEIDNREQVSVRCIVTWHSDREKTTVNLLAPLVLNTEKRMAKQVVLHDTAYTTRHFLWTNTEESGER